MATTVDERVVQLTLDNKQFNNASSDTIDSIEKLKKTLEFEGAIDSFDQIEKGIKKVDFSPMSSGVQEVGRQFTWLDSIVDATLRNITNRLIDSGERMIKSLSTDQITTGWSKYAEQTGAVQTIMAATAQQFSDTSIQMETVNSQLEKLTWFTDETSHKFNDMVSGIGKFTANNIGLETSVKAMEGIATWASLSGANTNEASRAIYNLAQAISVGSVKLIDWRSIENANMGTTEFKQTVIETAEEMGTLIKVADGLWSTLDGKGSVSIANFSENLNKGWFSSDVLLKSLERYGGFADQLNQFVEETGILTATALNYVEDYIDGTLDMAEAMKATGLNAEDLTKWLDELGSKENDLGRRAFRAAQETKTFQEAIDYVKEAVSSGWSTSFKYIFGDYLEAKEWWSEIAETMYDVFVVGGEIRNTILSMWKEGGGREDFLEGIRQGLLSIKKILDIFKEAWNEVWYGIDAKEQLDNQANGLLNLTKGFKELMEALMPTETTFNNLKDILKGLFTIIRTGTNVLKSFAKGFSPILNVANTLLGVFTQLTADVFRTLTNGLNSFFTESRLEKITYWLTIISNLVSGVLQIGLIAMFDVLNKIGDSLGRLWQRFQDNGGGIRGVIKTLIDTVNDFWQSFVAGETIANGVVNTILYIFGGLVTAIKAIIETIIGLVTGELSFSDLFNGKGGVADAVTGFGDILDKLRLQDKFQTIVGWIKDFVNELVDANGVITQFVYNITNAIAYLYDKLKGLLDQITIKDIKDFLLIAILWQFVSGLNKINLSLKGAIDAFKAPMVTFNNILKSLTGQSPLLDKLNTMFTKTTFLQIGIAVTLLVAALGKLNTLDYQKTQQSVAALGVTLTLLLVSFKTFNKILTSMPKKEKTYEMGEVIDNIGKNLLFISAGALMISQALKVLNDTLFNEAGRLDVPKFIALAGSIGLILTALVLATKSLANIEIGNTAGSIASIIGLAAGLRLVIGSVALLAAFDDIDKLIVAVASASAIILSLGKAVQLMRKIDWKSALSIVPLMVSFATAMITITGAIAILASLASGNSLAGALGVFVIEIVGVTGALVTLGLALKNVKASTITSISAAMLSLSSSMLILSAALKVIERYDWENSGKAVGALAIGFAELTAALAILGNLLKTTNPTVISTIATSITLMASSMLILSAAIRMLNGIKWEDIQAGVLTISALFVGLTALTGVIAFFDTKSFGMVSKSIDHVATAFIKFASAITILSAGVFLLAAASGVMATIVAAFQALATKIGVDLPTMISDGFNTLELIIKEFLEMIQNLAPDFLATFVSLFGLIATAIFTVKHPTAVAVAGVIMEILQVIESHGQDIINTLVALINLIKSADELFKALTDLAFTLGTFVAEAFVAALCGALSGLVGGITECFSKWTGVAAEGAGDSVSKAFKRTYTDALKSLTDPDVEAVAKGTAVNTMDRIIKAWIDGEQDLSNAEVLVALNAMKNFSDTMEDGSKEAVDKMFAQYKAGLEEKEGDFTDVMKHLGSLLEPAMGEGADPNKPYDQLGEGAWEKIAKRFKEGYELYGFDLIKIAEYAGKDIANAFQSGIDSSMSDFNFFAGTPKKTLKSTYSDYDASEETYGFSTSDKKKVEEKYEEVGEDAGNAYINALSDAITSPLSSGKTSGAAKSQAKTIAEAFSDEIDKISRDEQISDRLYKLWSAQNPTASDMEKSAKEIEYQTAKVNYQIQKAAVSQEIYQKTLAEMGESAKDTHEAYISMLDDQIELLEMQNKLAEMQQSASENTREAWERYNALIYQKTEDGRYVTDALREMGFSDDEIKKAYATEAGYTLPQAIDETKKNNQEALNNAAKSSADMYVAATTAAMSSEATIAQLKAAGTAATANYAQGAIESVDLIKNASNTLTNTAINTMDNEEVRERWQQAGISSSVGWGEGVVNEDALASATNAVSTLGNETTGALLTYLEMDSSSSPSGLYMTIGQMMDQGMINGIRSGASEVINAAVETAVAAYKAAIRALGIHSPSRLMYEVGMNFDKGLANGIIDYGEMVEKSTVSMINSLTDATSNSLSKDSIKEYLYKMFDLDDDSLNLTVIVDADTTKAEYSMSELEKAYSIGQGGHSFSMTQSGDIQTAIMPDTISNSIDALAKQEAYRSTQLQNLYDLVDSVMKQRKMDTYSSESPMSGSNGDTNIEFVQNNYSPKAISRVDTYRDTQRQLNTFATKFNLKTKR